MSLYLKQKLRDRAAALIQMLDLDAPNNILALSVRMVIDTATADFGDELYREMGEQAKINARQRYGLCSTCDEEVPVQLIHPPLCVLCEEKQEAMADEMEEQMRIDDEKETEKTRRLLDIIFKEEEVQP